jgi:hypothetical protein
LLRTKPKAENLSTDATKSKDTKTKNKIQHSENITFISTDYRLLASTTNSTTMMSPPQTSSLSSCAVKQSPIPFPWKLHEMLGDASCLNFDAAVSWLPEEYGFRVHDIKKFVETIMPRYFNQTKYKSFQRQLNMWGFERVQSGPFKGGYTHERFVRGQPVLCRHMRRQKVKGAEPRVPFLRGCLVPTATTTTTTLTTSDDSFEASLLSTPPAAADLIAELAPSGGLTDQQYHCIEQGNHQIALLSPADIACLEFEGRPFFGIFDDDLLLTKSRQPTTTASRGHPNLAMTSNKSRRRFSLEFLVPTHA